MVARIFRPCKTAMQSGEARTKEWVLEHEREKPLEVEPLMGWTRSRDTGTQVKLEFSSKDEAIAYAQRNGLAYTVVEPHARKPVRQSYADNFRHDRKAPWTH